MHYQYKTKGTCSRLIDFDLENGVVSNVRFVSGCNGNLKGIGRLVEGRKASEIAALLKGTDCGGRGTSCPDQFARGLEAAMAQK